MLALKVLSKFSQYRYFREIADFLKIKVPLVNQEILIPNDRSCIVHGIKQIELIPQVQIQPKIIDSQPQLNTLSNYVFDQHSQITIPFEEALNISKALTMDLCLIRQGSNELNPVLSVSTARKHIYSEYYESYVRRKGKHGFKTVRLGEKINMNDFLTKYQNVKRMIKDGERRFKLIATNDADKAQKIIIEFAKLFNKKVQPNLQSYKVPPRDIEQERWVANITINDEIEIDPQQINKKWRRRKLQKQQELIDTSDQDIKDFQGDSLQMEQQLYLAYKELDIKLPPKYEELRQIQKSLQTDKLALFRSVAKQGPEENEFQWDEQEERAFSQKMAKFNNEHFGQRSVEDIVSEMQELKKSGYESEAHKVARFKQLKAELEVKLKRRENFDL